ncbi:hypothetical protein [Burkholderia sp. PU8-34]
MSVSTFGLPAFGKVAIVGEEIGLCTLRPSAPDFPDSTTKVSHDRQYEQH